MPTLSIERRDVAAQPVLIIRRRIPRADLQATIADCFGQVFGHCQKVGIPLDGRPFTRYLSTGPGLWTIECGKPLATPARGEGEIEAAMLPAGPLAMAVHGGLYDRLPETYVAARTLDRSERLSPSRGTVGVLHHRPGRASRSRRLADRGLLAAARKGDETRLSRSAMIARAICVTRWPNDCAVPIGSSPASPHGATMSPQHAAAE